MDLTEILRDSFNYPLSDKKQFGQIFLVFILLGIVIFGSLMTLTFSTGITPLIMVICFLIAVIVLLIFTGYQLEIIGIACEQDDYMPLFNPVKNIKNGLRAILLYLVFYILNFLIIFVGQLVASALFSTHNGIAAIFALIIEIIIFVAVIIINWTFLMSLCRLAYYDSLDEALKIKEAYHDLREIGLANMLVYAIAFGLIFGVMMYLSFMAAYLIVASVSNMVLSLVAVMIVFAVLSYVNVVASRAVGLLYSNVVFDTKI